MSEFAMGWAALAQLVGAAEGAGGGVWPGLLAQLEAAGFGAQVQSWQGEGEKLPLTADELATAFTPQQIQAWAEQAGTTPDILLQRLAESMPHGVGQKE